ncbi:MAG: GvpL/GvpF family gas vesicle protein [Anaerolineae bacterium]
METDNVAPTGRYVYCVVQARGAQALDLRGIDDEPVSLVAEGDLGALVSPSEVKRYRLSRQHTLAHELVIEKAMVLGSVLPVKFGTVAEREALVREKLLQGHQDELTRLLAEMQGKVELGLKVSWDSERVYASIAEQHSGIRRLRDRLAANPAGGGHYERIELGGMVEEALKGRRQEEEDAIVRRLSPLAVDHRLNNVYGETMVLNGAFLVESAREADFDAEVTALSEERSGLLSIRYVGPLPPFNFVDLAISWN